MYQIRYFSILGIFFLINSIFSQENNVKNGKQFEQSANLNFKFYDYSKAIEEFNEAEKLVELSDISLYNRSMSYYKLKKYDSSLINLGNFIKRNNEELEYLLKKSKLMICLLNGANGNLDAMVACLKDNINDYDSYELKNYSDLFEEIYDKNADIFNQVNENLYCVVQIMIKSSSKSKYKDLDVENCKKKIEELQNQ